MSGEISSNTEALWDDFLRGNDNAFAGIYYTFINSLLSYGKKLTSDGELLHDAIQEIFMDIYLKRNNPHTPISNPKAYLFTALRNSILKKLNQIRKYEHQELEDHVLQEFHVEYSIQDQLITREISEEVHNRLQKAIISLSPGQKEIIYLKFEQNLEYKEIAMLMGITVESARKQLYRALSSLRETIDSRLIYAFFTFLIKNKEKVVHV